MVLVLPACAVTVAITSEPIASYEQGLEQHASAISENNFHEQGGRCVTVRLIRFLPFFVGS